jgi:hypothetical protein
MGSEKACFSATSDVEHELLLMTDALPIGCFADTLRDRASRVSNQSRDLECRAFHWFIEDMRSRWQLAGMGVVLYYDNRGRHRPCAST